MIAATQQYLSKINSPVRKIQAKVELYEGSTLLETFAYNDKLVELKVERVGEDSKFFGFGICQRLIFKLLDVKGELKITTANTIRVRFGVEDSYVLFGPTFYITQCRRDEKTNELTVYAYDALYAASTKFLKDANIAAPYTLYNFMMKAANFLCDGLQLVNFPSMGFPSINIEFPNGANFDGEETMREVLDDCAEASQTIYYINDQNKLIFRRLVSTADLNITRSDYFELGVKGGHRIQTIANATELGDNTSKSVAATGSTVYVRDNAFWTLRDDIVTILENAIKNVGGFGMEEFELEWRGNFLVEIGDAVTLQTYEKKTVTSCVLDDVIEYDGTLKETTRWRFQEKDTEDFNNDVSLGESLKRTFAKVDKANKTIQLVASEVDGMKGNVSELQMSTEGILASVKNIETNTEESLKGVNNDIQQLSSEVAAKMDADSVSIAIQKEMASGVDKITTRTGYTFNEKGLTIDKSGSEMKTEITEDGMTVYRGTAAVLVANNNGVEATNLHATTYLIIGKNSRIEDYGSTKTGVFWIG